MRQYQTFLLITLGFLLLVACNDDSQGVAGPTTAPSAVAPTIGATEPSPDDLGTSPSTPVQVEATATPIPPTPTPSEPLAAQVNGQPLFLARYEKELARYEQAQDELGLSTSDDNVNYRTQVLDALIETELIAQAAAENGISVTPEMVTQRFTELEGASGGQENFDAWLQANQWSRDEFREALATEMLTEQMVEFITSDVPTAVEQVRARYLQVDDATLAQSLLDQTRAGTDFAILAQQHSLDRITGENGGDLGFFARGTLLAPEVENAAFALEPGQVSEVIQATRVDGSGQTFYLVQVIERDPERALEPDLRFTLLQQKFEAWLSELWAQAEIIRFVDTGA